MNCIDQKIFENCAICCGDSIELIKEIPDNSIDYSIFSPPFAELYSYSNLINDMGNSKNYDEFFEHFNYLIGEMNRIIKPGRLVSIHCIDIPAMKSRDGYIGLKDFPGDIIRYFEKNDFIYHSRTTIWKDPLIEAVRTRAIGLAYKQVQKDSAVCRTGIPDYIITMRKKGDNLEPIENPDGFGNFIGDENEEPSAKGLKYNHHVWQKYASPVWMDIRQTRTLNYKNGKDSDDTKHICPLQLDTIERCITLWSKENDIVFTPFMGVGSEVYSALELNRRAVGIELKKTYFDQAVKNISKFTIGGSNDFQLF